MQRDLGYPCSPRPICAVPTVSSSTDTPNSSFLLLQASHSGLLHSPAVELYTRQMLPRPRITRPAVPRLYLNPAPNKKHPAPSSLFPFPEIPGADYQLHRKKKQGPRSPITNTRDSRLQIPSSIRANGERKEAKTTARHAPHDSMNNNMTSHLTRPAHPAQPTCPRSDSG